MSPGVDGFMERARKLAATVRKAGSVAVVSHIDADGITSAAIAMQALDRCGIPHSLHFVKSLGDQEVEDLVNLPEDLVWVCDLGTGAYEHMNHRRCVVTDHHQCFSGGQSPMDLYVYLENMLNPLLFGMNGATFLSGAGCTYYLARALDPANADLAYLAIVGAVGDMQDREGRMLDGPLHRQIIEDALSSGVLQVEEGELPFFGWITRSAAAMLAFSNELRALGFSDGIKDVSGMFQEAGVSLKRPPSTISPGDREKGATWKSWYELEAQDRGIIRIMLRDRLERSGLDPTALDRMLGEVYLFPEHPPRSPTREAKEFATLLNASGRYIITADGQGDEERGQLIVNVCLSPKVYSESALQNVDNHKVHLRDGVENVQRVVQMKNIQYLGPKGKGYCLKVNDTILGIIAGMILDRKPGERALVVDRDKPVVAFAERLESSEKGKDPEVKVSTRMSRDLTRKGINLGKAVGQASARVRGAGGGHDVAAGATIPRKRISAFLEALDEEIGAQLELSPSRRP